MRYPGGKGKCYQHIINLMPMHDTYIETHLGGGEPYRVCRRVNILRDYPDEKIKIYP